MKGHCNRIGSRGCHPKNGLERLQQSVAYEVTNAHQVHFSHSEHNLNKALSTLAFFFYLILRFCNFAILQFFSSLLSLVSCKIRDGKEKMKVLFVNFSFFLMWDPIVGILFSGHLKPIFSLSITNTYNRHSGHT